MSEFKTSPKLVGNVFGLKITPDNRIVLALTSDGHTVWAVLDPETLRKVAAKMLETANQAESQQKAGRN